ncbi:hypothetical protein TNCV_1719151 [Trichonephila clavipes]|nr:hypothetical protein TNCV_1719151 [Trichonephila clavipes]
MVKKVEKLDTSFMKPCFFPNENCFSTTTASEGRLIWRWNWTLFHHSNITDRDHCGGQGVVAWGDIMLSVRTERHDFDTVMCRNRGTQFATLRK